MQIWVDADACPRPIKEILYRAAERVRVRVNLVANRALHVPRSPFVRGVRVGAGFDVADRHIEESMRAGDLIVTGDIPLAAAAIERGGYVLGPRGEELTEENIREKLAVRDLMDQLRSDGIATGGPATHGAADRQAFANALDRLLTRHAPRRFSGPRDELGRPLPGGSPNRLRASPPRPADPDEAVRLGASLFDDGRFFEAHEVFEDLWKSDRVDAPEAERFKALAQVCVALCHVQRGNTRGAGSVLAKAEPVLERGPGDVRGIDARRWCAQARAAVAAASTGRAK